MSVKHTMDTITGLRGTASKTCPAERRSPLALQVTASPKLQTGADGRSSVSS